MPENMLSQSLVRLLSGRVIPHMLDDQPARSGLDMPAESGPNSSLFGSSLATRSLPASQHSQAFAKAGEDAQKLLSAVCHGDDQAVCQLLDNALRDGLHLDALLRHYIPAIVREAGVLWAQDRMSFADVTLTSSLLSQWINAQPNILAPVDGVQSSFAQPIGRRYNSLPRCVLWSEPQEQHVFGLELFALMLRRQGWQVISKQGVDFEELQLLLSQQSFTFCGLSLGRQLAADKISAWVDACRTAALDSEIKITIGGPMVYGGGPTAEAVGADFVSADADAALSFTADLQAQHVYQQRLARRMSA